VSDRTARHRERVLRFWLEDRSLTALLVIILVYIFILGPLHELDLVGRATLGVIFAFFFLTGIFVTAQSPLVTVVLSLVAFSSLTAHWLDALMPQLGLAFVDLVMSLVGCMVLTGIVFVQTNREGPITGRRIQGAVVVYLLIGIVFAFAYTLVLALVPGSFVYDDKVMEATHPGTVSRLLGYFSFVTLTTVGYGDIHAVHSLARSLAVMEALIGQLFPAVMLARLVSMEMYYRQRRFEREQAALDREALAREVARTLREEGRS
jgi:hypothetical protein